MNKLFSKLWCYNQYCTCIRLGLNQRCLLRETDYESGAFDHSATDACELEFMELVGIEPTSTQLTIVYSFTSLALFNI